jgi:hypothetical protein
MGFSADTEPRQSDLNLPSREREINGTLYRVTILPLARWYELEGLALDSFGDPLRRLFAAVPAGEHGGLDVGGVQTEALADVLHGVLVGLAGAKLARLVETMGDVLELRGADGWRRLSAAQIDAHMRRHMRDLVPVLLLHLEVQFADFFGGAMSALADVAPRAQTALAPPALPDVGGAHP